MKVNVRLTEQTQDKFLSFEDALVQVNVPLPTGSVDEVRVEQFIKDIVEAITRIRSGRVEKIRESVQRDQDRINKDRGTLDWLEERVETIRMGLDAQYERLENLEKEKRDKDED